jgi:hypothetical protein
MVFASGIVATLTLRWLRLEGVSFQICFSLGSVAGIITPLTLQIWGARISQQLFLA